MASDASEIDALRAALAAAEARATEAEAQMAEAARERAVLASAEATIAALRLEIEKLRRALYGTRSERKARLLDQLELQLEELEATATADDLAAEALGAAPSRRPRGSAGGRCASRSRRTCRASGSSSPRPPAARPAARTGSSSSARTSQRRWR